MDLENHVENSLLTDSVLQVAQGGSLENTAVSQAAQSSSDIVFYL